jgi:hypothetical protein
MRRNCGAPARVRLTTLRLRIHSLPLSTYNGPGGLRQDPGRAAESSAEARINGNERRKMPVLLSTYDSRGGVEPLVALAVRLRELGAEARVRAPPDCAERLAEIGVQLRAMVASDLRSELIT